MLTEQYFNVNEKQNWLIDFTENDIKQLTPRKPPKVIKSDYFSYEKAVELLKEGVKVRHCNQNVKFFCFQIDNEIYDEDGKCITQVFNRWKNDTFFHSNWEKASRYKQKLNIKLCQ